MLTNAHDCVGSWYGGCTDGGCHRSGGMCQSFGHPSRRDCRCVAKRRKNDHHHHDHHDHHDRRRPNHNQRPHRPY